jgi:uncharacterized protein (TIGR03000 family)
LESGHTYSYSVRAVMVRDGQPIEETKVVTVTAGDVVDLAFDFTTSAAPVTTLTLEVPADAKVALEGMPTQQTGAVRTYRTSELAAGEEIAEYNIVVTLERDRQTLTEERVISLKAGQSHALKVDFAATKVASNQ